MALSMRFYTNRPSLTANGRVYSASGGIVDVPINDAAAIHQQGGEVRLTVIGTTSDRPAYVLGVMNGGLPREMYDTTLGKPIYLVGSNPPSWVDVNGASA